MEHMEWYGGCTELLATHHWVMCDEVGASSNGWMLDALAGHGGLPWNAKAGGAKDEACECGEMLAHLACAMWEGIKGGNVQEACCIPDDEARGVGMLCEVDGGVPGAGEDVCDVEAAE